MSKQSQDLEMDERRGLVLRNTVEEALMSAVNAPRSTIVPRHQGFKDQPLQAYLVLWDRLAIPTGMNIGGALSNDEEFLVDCGVLHRRSVQGAGATVSLLMKGQSKDEARVEQQRLFQQLEAEAPGCWAAASLPGEEFSEPFARQGRALLVRLHNFIPVPHRSVALEDVFRFVEHRKPEQLALRCHLDDLYQGISAAGDGPLALQTEATRLKRAIADHHKAMEESGLRHTFAGLEAKLKWEFDAKALLTPAALGALVASLPGALAGAGLGVLGNLLPKVETELSLKIPKAVTGPRPFDYVVLMEREL